MCVGGWGRGGGEVGGRWRGSGGRGECKIMKVTGWPSMILSRDLQDVRVLGCKRLPLLHTVVLVHSREQIVLGREERGRRQKLDIYPS